MSGKTTDLSGTEVRKLLDHKKIPRWIQRGIVFWQQIAAVLQLVRAC